MCFDEKYEAMRSDLSEARVKPYEHTRQGQKTAKNTHRKRTAIKER